MTATASVSQTVLLFNAPSSTRTLVVGIDSVGTQAARATMVATPITATSTNAARQPSAMPSHEAAGTPTTFATDRPSITCPTAFARFRGPAMCAATSAATPKYAPCGRPATNRATRRSPYDGARTVARFPTVNATISAISRARRGTRAVSAAMVGAPTTTPRA